jgi:Flavin containing amine oxidoreductase
MTRGSSRPIRRRTLLAGAALAPSALLMACSPDAPRRSFEGGWIGAQVDRGHLMRDRKAGSLPMPQVQKRAGVIVLGAGIAGLGAARTLMRAGVDDVRVFDLEDTAGGNSRGHSMGGMGCPLGAHYLPTPSDQAIEVIELLEALGLRRTERGQVVYDEFDLCHSPQERLYIAGHWHEGLLPPIAALPFAERAKTLAQYRQFSALVEAHGTGDAFAIPTARSAWNPTLDALDAVAFAPWLAAQGLDAPALRWYLDYCCRDDYGAGAAQVSAWAGLHYFASRHGFHAPGDASDDHDGGLLTWPEGNAWLSRQLAASLGDRLQTGSIALRVTEDRHDASVDLLNTHTGQLERWTAPQVVMAMPTFISARLLASPNAALSDCAGTMRHAPWLVGNLQLDDALDDRPGAPPSWDNVFYEAGPAGAMLGYVDAMHQSTRSVPGATVLTSYWALGGDTPEQLKAQRARLLNDPWQTWASQIVQDIARAHPDLQQKLTRIDLMRYGHAMCIPTPGLRSSAALRALAEPQRRVHFAHSDLSAYSVFEEALYHGVRAGSAAGRGLSG